VEAFAGKIQYPKALLSNVEIQPGSDGLDFCDARAEAPRSRTARRRRRFFVKSVTCRRVGAEADSRKEWGLQEKEMLSALCAREKICFSCEKKRRCDVHISYIWRIFL